MPRRLRGLTAAEVEREVNRILDLARLSIMPKHEDPGYADGLSLGTAMGYWFAAASLARAAGMMEDLMPGPNFLDWAAEIAAAKKEDVA
jgi:hypothetical protein